MENAKHTPGPWEILELENPAPYPGIESFTTRTSIVIYGMHGEDCGVRGRTQEECAANAELIAKAPETAVERDRLKALNAELVEALGRILDYSSVCNMLESDTLDSALAVLSKAKTQEAKP